MFWFTS